MLYYAWLRVYINVKEEGIYDNCSLLEVSLYEGRNRQIRRMFETLGYEVQELDRISFGKIGLSGLKRGQWRFLTPQEIRYLRNEVRAVND